MAVRIIHIGEDSCHRLWVLKRAGYAVEDCSHSTAELHAALRSDEEPDAVLITEGDHIAPHAAISLARSHTTAPLILFRDSHRSYVEAGFDLVIPVLAPPESWLTEIASLITKSQLLRTQSEGLRAKSFALREESATAREKSRGERERSSRARSKKSGAKPGFVKSDLPKKK